MQIKEAVTAGLRHNHKAQEKVLARKMCKKEVTAPTFAHVFSRFYTEAGFGKVPILTKKDWGMLKTFLVVLQGTGWDKDQIFDLIKKIVTRWEEDLAGKEVTTLRFKKIVLPMRPNIRALLWAKTDIIAILYETKKLRNTYEDEEVGGFFPE